MSTDIEKMLSLRPSTSFDDCPEIDALAQVLAGVADDETQKIAKDHLADCSECQEAVLALEAMNLEDPLPAPGKFFRGKSSKVILSIAAVLLAAIGAVLFFEGSPKENNDSIPGLVPKGSADGLNLAVQRRGVRFVAHPLDTLIKGDHLGLFYSAADPGYLAIIAIDGEADAAVLFPVQGDLSGAIDRGNKAPLPDGAVVGDGTGCEWLVAVFSDEPLELDSIIEKIKGSPLNGETCKLQVKINQARSVIVFPVRR